jgi:hypothetical protein
MVYPSSTTQSDRHELEYETYHFLGWSHPRIERIVGQLLGGIGDAGAVKNAAQEVVAAFGMAGPPEMFWVTQLGRRCVEAGFGPKA